MSAKRYRLGQTVLVDYKWPGIDRHARFIGVITQKAENTAYIANADNLTENDRGVIRRGGGAAFWAECYPWDALQTTLRKSNHELKKTNEEGGGQ